MPKPLEVTFFDQKMVVVAALYSEYEVHILREAGIDVSGFLRRTLGESLAAGKNTGWVTMDIPQHREGSFRIQWDAYPLWWSDHPRWYEAPFCCLNFLCLAENRKYPEQ